jgi:hypothetical protein
MTREKLKHTGKDTVHNCEDEGEHLVSRAILVAKMEHLSFEAQKKNLYLTRRDG